MRFSFLQTNICWKEILVATLNIDIPNSLCFTK